MGQKFSNVVASVRRREPPTLDKTVHPPYCCNVRTYSAIKRSRWSVVALGQPIFRSSISRSKICPQTGMAESP
jgi:hypothetical protein